MDEITSSGPTASLESLDYPKGSEQARPFGWPGSLVETLLCLFVLLLGVLVTRTMIQPEYQPKRVVLLLALPIGGLAFVRLLRARDLATIAALAFLCWSIIVSLISDAPGASLIVVVNQHSSVLMVAASFGLWALARNLTEVGRSLVAWTLVVVCGINGVVAIWQVVAKPTGVLDLHRGRPTGLVIAPIILGALAVAVAIWFVSRFVERGHVQDAVGFGLSVFVVALTGTRAPMLISAMAVVAGIALRRRWSSGYLAVAAVAGYGLASALYSAAASEVGLASRTVSSGGISDRMEVWSYALKGWWERPITGYGTGRFQAAARPLATDEWVRRFPGDAWSDAHNLVFELLVTVGVPGLILFSVFAVLASRTARGPLAWMCGAIVLTWMVEPATLVTLPIAAVLLGGAMTCSDSPEPAQPFGTRSFGVACAAGVLLAGSFVAGDAALDGIPAKGEGPPLSGLATWFRYDPEVLTTIAYGVPWASGLPEETGNEIALEWATAAVAAEPVNVQPRNAEVGLLIDLDRLDLAQEAVDEALEIWPNDALLLRWSFIIAIREGDVESARSTVGYICEIYGQADCDVDEAVELALADRKAALEEAELEAP